MNRTVLAFSLIVLSRGLAAADASPAAPKSASVSKLEPAHLAYGINGLGEELRVHFSPNWAAEGRFQIGNASSNEGKIQAMVFGLRGYRFFQEHRRCKLYLGLEGAYAQTSIHGSPTTPTSPTGQYSAQQSGFGNTTGFAGGGFAGIELRPLRRIAVDFDMGPYLIDLKEKTTGTAGSNWDFVVNFAVLFYFF